MKTGGQTNVRLNIVFDLGGVVFNWQPDAIIKSVFEDRQTQALVRREIFEHPDWVALDKGTLPLYQAVDRAATRTGLPQEDVERLLNAVPRFLTPIEETIQLIHDLASTDSRLFILSNMHIASIAHLEEQHSFWHLFDGIVISSRIKMVKPEARIYRYLLSEYRLDPAETIFIDDTGENLTAASATGIQTIQFVNPSQCRQELVDRECM